jgi:hypothetical protein
MALIKAKADEHERHKLLKDDQDLMDTAATRWTKVAREVQATSFVDFFRGFTACKEKWTTMYGDYKKLKDYRSAIGHSKDYFKMTSKRRKELTLPANFVSFHFNKMDKFLS